MAVKFPVIGRGAAVAEATRVGVKVGFNVGVDFGLAEAVDTELVFGVAVGVGVVVEPDWDAVKAGTSPALTTKSLVKSLVIPLASIQEMVIV